jgi:hypothetical protein
MSDVLDRSHKKKIGGPITLGDDDPVTKYKAESDGRMFWAYNGMEVFYDDERMYAALDEIERLTKIEKAAIALRDDMILRADIGTFDGDHSVQAGASVWRNFCNALDIGKIIHCNQRRGMIE